MKRRPLIQDKPNRTSPDNRVLWMVPLISLLPAVGLISFSLPFPWFTDRAEPVYQRIIAWISLLSLLGGAAMIWRPLRERSLAFLDRAGELPKTERRAWLGTIYLGIASFFFYVKYCQYRGFQLPEDTAVVSNMAFNFLHGLSFENAIYGVNHFAIHFQPLNALYAPLLLFGNSTIVLLAAQIAVVCSAPFAVYGLIRNRTGSGGAAAAGFWLCVCSPFMFSIAANNLEAPANLAALFLWGMYFLEQRRFSAALLFLGLAACATEQAPLAFIGLGLYLLLKQDSPFPRARAWGAAVCVISGVLFILEMKIISSFPQTERLRDWPLMYGHLGPSPEAALSAALTHPLALLKIVAWPTSKLDPFGRLLWTTGFFCAVSPAAFVAWFINYAPSFLAAPGTSMAQLDLHYAAQTLGPVWWAMALGLSAVILRLAPSKRQSFVLAWSLLVGGWGICHTPKILIRDWKPAYYLEGPGAVAAVPGDASVWTSEFLAPWLGCRSRLKVLGNVEDEMLRRHLFMPDYLVLTKDWFPSAEPVLRQKVAALVAKENYERVVNSTNFIVFKHPRAPLPRTKDAPSYQLPEPVNGIDFTPRVHIADAAK